MLAVVPPYNNKHQREDLWLNKHQIEDLWLILERPFRPLELLNLWTYRYPGARYPLNPWTLEP